MPADLPIPLRCPYPTCPNRGNSLKHLSRGVYQCESCSRLSVMCSDPEARSRHGSRRCTALNRPYSQHCRRCKAELLSRRRGLTIAERWRKAGQFHEDYRLSPAPADRPKDALGETTCVTLLHDLEGARSPSVLLEWKFVDGVLAVHQGGGFMALVNPFDNLGEDKQRGLPIWAQPEEAHVEVPDADYEAALFRPYPPVATHDRRYLFFSTPYAAFALDLCSLPGWTAGHRNAEFRTLVDCAAGLDVRLAAAPIPLTQDPYQVGVLLYEAARDEYRWLVLDVAGGSVARPQPGDGVALPSVHGRPSRHGCPCQIAILEDLSTLPSNAQGVRRDGKGDPVIALSTAQGHWLWRFSDALKREADAMRRKWPAGDSSGTICLDYHIDDRRRFSLARQYIGDLTGEGHAFEWYYQCSPDGIKAGQLEYFQLLLGTLDATLPTPARDRSGALPIGTWRPPFFGKMLEMLFLDPTERGELYRCPIGVAPLNFVDILMDFNKIVGLWLDDPLLMVLANDSGPERFDRPATPAGGSGLEPFEEPATLAGDSAADRSYEITILSLRDRRQRIRAGQLQLRADPLVWARWLFTCRLDDASLAIYRSEIPIAKPL